MKAMNEWWAKKLTVGKHEARVVDGKQVIEVNAKNTAFCLRKSGSVKYSNKYFMNIS